MSLKDVKTRFVLDRIRETSWNDRLYIENLQFIEGMIFRGGPKCFAEGIAYHHHCTRYPIEVECIRKEIKEGIYTSPPEFQKLLYDHRRKLQLEKLEQIQAREREMAEERAREEAEWKLWLSLGGRP
jgi:hypothetical protein